MNKQITRSNRSVLRRIIKAFMAGVLPVLVLMFGFQGVRASSATWNLNPPTGDWDNAANWTPGTVPNGPSDVATFDISNTPTVSLSKQVIEVAGNGAQ